jgi:adenine phosphoribosyltransferase
MKISELKKTIREIPDYPKKGILFYDITTLLQNPKAFQKVVDTIANRYIDKKFDSVVCIDSRGFIIGAALAYKLCKGLVLVRKKGKLPYRTIRASYELEYGTDEIEVHEDAVKKGQKVIIVDDLLATGGTAKAAIELVNKSGGAVKECAFIIELTELGGRKKLSPLPVFSLLKY